MPHISTNNSSRNLTISESTTKAEAAVLVQQLATQLEEEICLALLEGNVALAQRLALPQARLKQLGQVLQ